MLLPLGEANGCDAWTVEAPDGRIVAVFVADGVHHVTDARCPHNGGPLVEGTVHGGTTLVCPWHRFRFDLSTGACSTHRRYDLRVYPVVERDGVRFADLGDPPRRPTISQRLRSFARGRY